MNIHRCAPWVLALLISVALGTPAGAQTDASDASQEAQPKAEPQPKPKRPRPHIYQPPARPGGRNQLTPEAHEQALQRHALHAFDDVSLALASFALGATFGIVVSSDVDSFNTNLLLGALIAPALSIAVSETLRYTVPCQSPSTMAAGLSAGVFMGTWLGILPTAQRVDNSGLWIPVVTAVVGGAAGSLAGTWLPLPATFLPMATTTGVAVGALAALIDAAVSRDPQWAVVGLIGTGVGSVAGGLIAAFAGPPSGTGLLAAGGTSLFGAALGAWVTSASTRLRPPQTGVAIGLGAGMAAGAVLLWALHPSSSQDATAEPAGAWQMSPTLLPPIIARGKPTPGLAAAMAW